MEDDNGIAVNVVGHKEALEKTLRDKMDDIDNADYSGPSRRSDFSQSTGNSTNNTDATIRMHTHRNRALTTIALVNKNSALTNHLEDSEEQLNAMIAQNLMLQEQLASLRRVPNSSTFPQDSNGDTKMEEDGPDMIRGGGGQGLGSKCSEESLVPNLISNPAWGYGAGPVGQGQIPSPDDPLPYQRTGENISERSRASEFGHAVAHGAGNRATYGDDTGTDKTCSQGWSDFLQAVEIHWKWPVTDPQHP
jgi:hypothetical protein